MQMHATRRDRKSLDTYKKIVSHQGKTWKQNSKNLLLISCGYAANVDNWTIKNQIALHNPHRLEN